MNSSVGGLVLILVGILVISLRKRLARYLVNIQNKTFGFHYGEKEIKANEWLLPLLSILAIVIGILSLLGIFEWDM